MKLKGNYYDENYVDFKVKEGVLVNRSGARLIALNEDFLKGFRKALIEETGEAHHIVFETCGKTWGERLVKNFEKELSLYYEVSFQEMPMSMFTLLFKSFWEEHGWGDIHVDWETGFQHGLFEIHVNNPAFSDIFSDNTELNDDIFVGVLEAFFNHFSGQELKCYQTSNQQNESMNTSSFILGLPERLEKVPDMVLSGKSHQEIKEAIA